MSSLQSTVAVESLNWFALLTWKAPLLGFHKGEVLRGTMSLLTLFCSMKFREWTEGKDSSKAPTCSYFWVPAEAVSLQLKELSLLHPVTSSLCKPATDSRLLSYPQGCSCFVFYSLKLLIRKCVIFHLSYRTISMIKSATNTTIPYSFLHLHLLEFPLGNSRSYCIVSYALSWIFLGVYVYMDIVCCWVAHSFTAGTVVVSLP